MKCEREKEEKEVEEKDTERYKRQSPKQVR